MDYSVIIATYNRLPELKELLASAEKLDFARECFEIIFADDGSDDGSSEFIRGYQSPSGLNIRYLFQQNAGPGEARNYGMREAKGRYFIFVDSDCLFPSDWLMRIDTHLKNDPLDAFGGPDDCHPSFSPLLKAINYSMTSFIGTGGTRGSKKSVQKKFYPRSFNMGLSREVFEKAGGMIRMRHGQDMEFSARIYRHGFKVGLIPDAIVFHKRRTSLKRFFKQIFNWGVARVNLGRLDSNMLKPIHFMPSLIVAGFILMLLITPLLVIFAPVAACWLWLCMAAGFCGIALLAIIQSFVRYRHPVVSLLSVATLFIQVFAYGSGMIRGLMQLASGRQTAEGFTKNYYK